MITARWCRITLFPMTVLLMLGSLLVTSVVALQKPLQAQASGSPAAGWNNVIPSNSDTTHNYQIVSTACLSSTSCVAVGSYTDSSGYSQTLIEDFNGSSWSEISSVVDASSTANNYFNSVACGTTVCWAVGDYVDGGGYSQPLADEFSSGSWSTTLTYPASTSSSQQNYLDGVTCSSDSSCWAVGVYVNSVDKTFSEQLSSGTWSISYPNNYGTDNSLFVSISCMSSTACFAAGYYENSSGYWQTLIESLSSTTWGVAQSPWNIDSTNNNQLLGISCVSGTNDCWAAGTYYNSYGNVLILQYNGTGWSYVSTPNTPSTWNLVNGVTCASTTDCMAVGENCPNSTCTSGTDQTEVEQWDGTSWYLAVPSDSSSTADNALKGVGCVPGASPDDCLAVGYYDDSSGDTQPMAEQYGGPVQAPVAQAAEWPQAAAVGDVSMSSAPAAQSTIVGAVNTESGALYRQCSDISIPSRGVNLDLKRSYNSTLPSTSGNSDYPLATTCVSSSDCWAVGYFCTAIAGGQCSTGSYAQTLIEQYNGTSWSTVPAPNEGSGVNNQLRAVTCTSSTNCWATGTYVNSSGYNQPLIEEYNGTDWSIATDPSTTSTDWYYLDGVSCSSSSFCEAVGVVVASGLEKTLAVEYNGTNWSIVTSLNEGTSLNNLLVSVSCLSSSDTCIASGYYYNAGGYAQPLAAEESSGSSWAVGIPGSPVGTDQYYLDGVTCNSTTDCWAVGVFVTSVDQQLIEHYNGSGWTTSSVTNEGSSNNLLVSVSCTSSTTCWAAGYYEDTSSEFQPLVEADSSGTWTDATPPSTSSTQSNQLLGISCASSSSCLTVGSYVNSSSDSQALSNVYNGSSWSIPSGTNIPTGGMDNVWNSGVEGGFGYGWSSNLGVAIYENSAGNQITVLDSTGAPVVFDLVGSIWTAPEFDASTLTTSGGNWTYTNAGGDIFTFNSSGQLTKETDRNGIGNAFAYTGSELTSVTDASGSRKLQLGWTSAGTNINQVEDPDSQYVYYTYDPSGDLITVEDQNGKDTSFTYDGNHNLLSETDPNGNTISYAYSSTTGQVLNQTAPEGAGGSSTRVTTYAYTTPTTSETQTLLTDPNGYETQYTFTYSLLTQAIDAYGQSYATTTTYLHDPATLGVYEESNAIGTVTFNTYDGDANLTSSTTTPQSGTPTSITTSATYNSDNEPLTRTDGNGTVTSDYYDSDGNLCWETVDSVANTGGGCTSFPTLTSSSGTLTKFSICESSTCSSGAYDQGDIESMTDPDGNITTYSYDSYGDLAASTNAAGDETCYGYDLLGRKTWETAPLGNSSSCSSSGSYTTQYTYNPLNEVLTVVAPSPTGSGTATTTNQYDNDGNLWATQDPMGDWTFTSYDADSEMCWTDPTGTTETYTSPPTSCTAPTGASSTTYDADGNVSASYDPDGNETAYTYNSLNQKVSQTVDPGSSPHLNEKTTYTYDGDSNVLSVVSPDGNASTCTGSCTEADYTTTNSYDGYDRLLTTKDPNGYTTTYSYDNDGNVLTTEDGIGNYTTNTYTLRNQLCWTYVSSSASTNHCSIGSSGQGQTGSTAYSYDADGNTLSVEDPNSNYVTNGYNDAGEDCWSYRGYNSTNSCSSVPSAATQYSYDADGNNTKLTEPSAATIYNTYNHADLLCVSYDGSSSQACGSTPSSTLSTYSYDADGHKTGMGDGTGSSSYTYNYRGQMTSYTNGNSAEVQYTDDYNGNSTEIIYPTGTKVWQQFNAANEPCWTDVASSSPGTGCSTSYGTSYAYDSNNNLTAEDLANGVDNTYSFDYDNNISSISDGTSGATFAATYTRNGDDLIASDSSQPSNKDYTYTSKKQVCYVYSSSETCGSSNSGAYAYAYDAAGNLTTDNGNAQAFSSTAGKTDELCWSYVGSSGDPCGTVPTGATTYTYNTNGDRTAATPSSGSASAYTYNDFNQQTQYQLGSGTATTYTYDGTGLRMSKTTGSSTTQYSWSGDGSDPELLQETTGSNTTSYIYGPNGLPIEEILPSGSAYYYSSDALGSTRALTNSSGTTVDTDEFDPQGNLTSSTGSTQDNLLFQGQYLDSESGLYYLRARYYDPTTGQFMTVDPDLASTNQPYAFTNGDPVNATDASGQMLILNPGEAVGNVADYAIASHDSPAVVAQEKKAVVASYSRASSANLGHASAAPTVKHTTSPTSSGGTSPLIAAGGAVAVVGGAATGVDETVATIAGVATAGYVAWNVGSWMGEHLPFKAGSQPAWAPVSATIGAAGYGSSGTGVLGVRQNPGPTQWVPGPDLSGLTGGMSGDQIPGSGSGGPPSCGRGCLTIIVGTGIGLVGTALLASNNTEGEPPPSKTP